MPGRSAFSQAAPSFPSRGRPTIGAVLPTASAPARVRHAEPVMGTVVSFDLRPGALSAEQCRRAPRRACGVLQDVDATFSTWKPGSPVSRLRRAELRLEELPPEVSAVLRRCQEVRELSGRWFDPWAMPGGVDPTGFVKGWAAQRASDVLAEAGIAAALVNAAGDVVTFGTPENERPWRIGIRDPLRPERLWCAIDVNGALATSGHYERPGQVLDPHTRRPAHGALSASVTGPDLGTADALATGLLAAGVEGLHHLAAAGGYAGYMIRRGGVVSVTPGFPAALRLRRSSGTAQPGPTR